MEHTDKAILEYAQTLTSYAQVITNQLEDMNLKVNNIELIMIQILDNMKK